MLSYGRIFRSSDCCLGDLKKLERSSTKSISAELLENFSNTNPSKTKRGFSYKQHILLPKLTPNLSEFPNPTHLNSMVILRIDLFVFFAVARHWQFRQGETFTERGHVQRPIHADGWKHKVSAQHPVPIEFQWQRGTSLRQNNDRYSRGEHKRPGVPLLCKLGRKSPQCVGIK